jgi:acetyl esterase/lipase
MRYIAIMISIATLLAGGGAVAASGPDPMTYPQFKALAQPPGGEKVAYGAGPSQFAELWLPKAKGPHPVVIVLHGGCWQKEVAGLGYMNAAAQDLAARGMAVWSVEYRGVDEPGGGYPGTFQDVAAGIDRLRAEAPGHDLDLSKVVILGHSAGGHLGLWAAGRPNLAKSSPLYKADPLPISAVVGVGALPDLEHTDKAIALVCGENIVGRLTGPASPAHADVFGDTSPVNLAPLHVPAVLVHGVYDPIAPPWIGMDYRKAAGAKGDKVDLVAIPNAGHFELVWPGAPAWQEVAKLIEAALR